MRLLLFIMYVCLLTCVPVLCQKQADCNLLYTGYVPFRLGFHLGMHSRSFCVPYSPGFTVGATGNLRVHRYLSILMGSAVYFGKQTSFSMPVDIKYSIVRQRNYCPYMIAGIYGGCNLGKAGGKEVLFKRADVGVEAGMGCDFYLPYFALCPELKFRFGLNGAKMVVFVFNFE